MKGLPKPPRAKEEGKDKVKIVETKNHEVLHEVYFMRVEGRGRRTHCFPWGDWLLLRTGSRIYGEDVTI